MQSVTVEGASCRFHRAPILTPLPIETRSDIDMEGVGERKTVQKGDIVGDVQSVTVEGASHRLHRAPILTPLPIETRGDIDRKGKAKQKKAQKIAQKDGVDDEMPTVGEEGASHRLQRAPILTPLPIETRGDIDRKGKAKQKRAQTHDSNDDVQIVGAGTRTTIRPYVAPEPEFPEEEIPLMLLQVPDVRSSTFVRRAFHTERLRWCDRLTAVSGANRLRLSVVRPRNAL